MKLIDIFSKWNDPHITYPLLMINIPDTWWKPEHNFFGTFYMDGDNSLDGYRRVRKTQTLKERTDEEVYGVIHLCKLNSTMHIYDMPCGYGRHANKLGSLGYTVTGLDINSDHLKKAREGMEENSLVTFAEHNMLNPLPVNSADVCINMFYSFGFFASDQENKLVLQHVYDSLKAHGRFLMHTDVNVPTIETGDYKLTESRTLSNGRLLHIQEDYNPETKRIHGSWTIDTVTRTYSVRVYTEKEFKDLCLSVGFREVVSYGDWDGSPYSPKSEIMILVATK